MLKVIHQKTENERLLLLLNFVLKYELVFVLKQENADSQRFYFKVNRKIIGFSKEGARNFYIGKYFLNRHLCDN